MKLKINLLYAAGIVLLIGSASVGDGFNTILPNSWNIRVLATVLMAALAITCFGYGRYLEMTRKNRRYGRVDRTHARTEEPDYRQNRRGA
ncbi:hypothetical protein LKD26_08480 [Faecalibacterium sp. CLA-AA-H254]|uniref:hypothetical protein n=1 Tax=Faecalibacterium hominis (ex Afrizal et al. 2022) TaxID=2881265 RepID=UPI001D0E0420|nr:hypothetical protein [Faecalibacterium hominis (ex Afrizal et al. 2022)]MCC2123150.1 hypothetical protein [Faecalibacterium hominis (ex Afrizal et al. 2022)]